MAEGAPCWDSQFYEIPLYALNIKSRKNLAMRLNIPNLKAQDWSGLAELMGFEYLDIQNFELDKNPTDAVLKAYTKMRDSSVGRLLDYLKELDRPDILEDCLPAIEKDVSTYIKKNLSQPDQVNEVSTSLDQAIVRQDVVNNQVTPFHAFVSHCENDMEFVHELIEELEEKQSLKLCIPERDLLGGVAKYPVTAELIETRCWRTIIVLSPSYLRSKECDFEIKFAQALNPGSQGKKLVPVMCYKCDIPPILRFITVLDATKGSSKCEPHWFWTRLATTLQAPPIWLEDDHAYRNLGAPLIYPMPKSSYPSESSSSDNMDNSISQDAEESSSQVKEEETTDCSKTCIS